VISVVALLLVLGPVVTDERPVDAPVYWATGAQPTALELPGGVLIGTVDRQRAVLQFYSRDGGLGPEVDLPDRVTSTSPLQLTQSSLGVVISYVRLSTSAGFAVVYDPVNRVFLGAPQPIGGAYYNKTYVAGQPGHLFFAHLEYIDDGLHTLVRALDDDGVAVGVDTDLTVYGSLESVASSSAAHWANFTEALPDGGNQTALVRIDSNGAATSATYLDDLYPELVATANHVVLGQSGATFRLAFYTSLGSLVARANTPSFCAGHAVAAAGDSVFLVCGVLGAAFDTVGFRVLRLEVDGGSVDQLLFSGDGGAIAPEAITVAAAPLVLYSRRFNTVGRGNHRAAMALPLDDTGLVAVAPPFEVLVRPSSQLSPAFSSRVTSTPLALAWNDDRQLLREYLLEAVRLGPDGQALEAPTALQPLTSNFTNFNHLHRFIADDGQAFVLPTYNAFLIEVLEWPLAAGAPITRGNIMGGIFGPPSSPPPTHRAT